LDRLLEKLWKYVARDQNLSMQRRLYRMICLITALLCFLVILPLNYLQDLPPLINVGIIIFGLLCLYLYWETFHGRDRVLTYFIMLLLLLDLIWFPNAGSGGSIIYYFAAAIIYPMAFCRGRLRWILVFGLVANVFALMIIEYLYPSLVVPFASPEARLSDHLTGIFSSALAGAMILWVVITNYDWEHDVIAKVSKELALSEKKYREVVETASTIIIRMDRLGTITFFNAFAEKLFGFRRSDIMGRNIVGTIFRAPAAVLERMLAATEPQVRFDSENTASDGKSLWISWTVQQVSVESQEPAEFLCVGTDITERKLLDEQRRQLDKQMLHVQKIESLGVLAGGIAHDFNNILASILGNISLVRMDLDPASPEHERLGEAEKASLHASELTTQLLTFSRGGSPVKKTVALDRLLRDAFTFSLRGSKVRSAITINPDLWNVDADAGQLGQVFNNLIINACQAMPSGGTVTLVAENVQVRKAHGLLLPEGRYVRVRVRDEGTGIMEEHLPQIFDPYFTTKQSGSGLGLAVTFSVIKNHEGHIAVQSKLGEGAVFTVHLPASEHQPATQLHAEPASRTVHAKVLVMDDEPMVCDVAGAILKRYGHTVEFARDGNEAVILYQQAAASSKPFDVVLMDLTIPGGMGGKETIQKLRELAPQVRAIASSGYSNDPIMANYQDYGFSAVIAKPYRPADLSAVLQCVLKNPT
jgi:two-component system, cell cycle sensor histidine kinase and response regulator CckA